MAPNFPQFLSWMKENAQNNLHSQIIGFRKKESKVKWFQYVKDLKGEKFWSITEKRKPKISMEKEARL